MRDASVATSWHSYPKVWALGHAAIRDIFADPVIVEEKIDGSQFSAGIFNGEFRARSKAVAINVLAPERMFVRAVETAQGLPFRDGWTYRFEYLATPKHNTLAYDRIPRQHLILLDVNPAYEQYLTWAEKADEAARLGLEVAPLVYTGHVQDYAMFREFLERESVLGGQKVEGVVAKNYARFTVEGRAMLGKFVSEAFKETHARVWREDNPKPADVIERLADEYTSPARWQKALQHLREAGRIEGSPRDIGVLMREVWPDIEAECREEITEKLYAWAAPRLRRLITRGLPEWYKDQLLKQAFAEEGAA